MDSKIELVQWLAIDMQDAIVGWLCGVVGYWYGVLMLAFQDGLVSVWPLACRRQWLEAWLCAVVGLWHAGKYDWI